MDSFRQRNLSSISVACIDSAIKARSQLSLNQTDHYILTITLLVSDSSGSPALDCHCLCSYALIQLQV